MIPVSSIPSSGARLVLIAMALSGCSNDAITPSEREVDITPWAESYLNEALDIMEANAIFRLEVDWQWLREQARNRADHSVWEDDTYPAIRWALSYAGGAHSSLFTPAQLATGSIGGPASYAAPTAMRLEEDLGYITVPEFGSPPGFDANELATTYHRLIESVDTLGVCGWVVDLRGNRGGNMWPMLAGVGPILGVGLVGSFLRPDSVSIQWRYADGAAWSNDFPLSEAQDPYSTLDTSLPVAVLTDALVASSGEAIAIAFRGRPNTRSFGFRTAGYSTANAVYTLRDGAKIVLTTSWMVDRNGKAYGNAVEPDQPVPVPTENPSSWWDVMLDAGSEWLRSQPTCANN